MDKDDKESEYLKEIQNICQQANTDLYIHNLPEELIPILKQIGREFWKQFFEGLIIEGKLSSSTTLEQLRSEQLEFLKQVISKETRFFLITDHTKQLLKLAEHYFQSRSFDLSALFYATYFEHHINSIIIDLACKKGLSETSRYNILRETQIRGKCTWLLELLGAQPIPNEHLTTILQISEIRNSFVHYKWQSFDVDTDRERSHKKKRLARAQETVEFLTQFEHVAVYGIDRAVLWKSILQDQDDSNDSE